MAKRPRLRHVTWYRTRWPFRPGRPVRTSRAERPRDGGTLSSTRRNEVVVGDWLSTSRSTVRRWPSGTFVADRRRTTVSRCRVRITKTHATRGRMATPTAAMWRLGDPTIRAAIQRKIPLPKTIHPRADNIRGPLRARSRSRLALDGHPHLSKQLGEDRVGGPGGHGRVRRDDDAVGENGERERLHVVGNHVVPALGGGE